MPLFSFSLLSGVVLLLLLFLLDAVYTTPQISSADRRKISVTTASRATAPREVVQRANVPAGQFSNSESD
jgi:hypothetical protein